MGSKQAKGGLGFGEMGKMRKFEWDLERTFARQYLEATVT